MNQIDYRELVDLNKAVADLWDMRKQIVKIGEFTVTEFFELNANAITELLIENQALRNAANGFKKQVETAEKKAEKAERERDIYLEWLNTVRPCQFCHHILPDPTPECEECGRCRTKYKPKFVLRDLDKE